jgi:hypothetical protein
MYMYTYDAHTVVTALVDVMGACVGAERVPRGRTLLAQVRLLLCLV